MPRPEKVDYSSSPQALANQLDIAHERITVLEARARAYAARLGFQAGTSDQPHRQDPDAREQKLLERLAEALLTAGVVEQAHTSAALHDGPPATALRDNSRPLPGSKTHPARARANELRYTVAEALDRWDWALENGFTRPPRQSDDIPTVRCGVRTCAARDVTVKAWRRVRGGRTIYHERCSSCGTPYPQPEENGDAA